MSRLAVCSFVEKCCTSYLRILLLLALPVVAVLSWVMNMMDESVCSILDANGIRWSVANMITNLYDAPVTDSLVLFICAGVLHGSGFLGTVVTLARERKWKSSTVSLKQRRALMLTVAVLEVMLVIFAIQMLLPNPMLLSAFGSYEASALSKGMGGLVAMLAIILGNVYGYASGKLATSTDFITAHTCIISRCAGYYVTLFLSAEVMACIKYAGLLSIDASTVLTDILYYVPLVVYLTSSILSSSTYHR